jgi:hypothetical protein
MKTIKDIPRYHYEFLKNFFKDEPQWWDSIKDDYAVLRCWAITLKQMGQYNVDVKQKPI